MIYTLIVTLLLFLVVSECSRFVCGGGFGKPSVPPAVSPPKTSTFAISKTGAATTAAHIPTLDLSHYPQTRQLHADPPVFEIPNFFSPEECANYISISESPHVYKMNSQTYSTLSKRTSTTWYLPYSIAPALLHRAQLLTGIPLECYEEPQIVRYEMGQQFTWHHDALPKVAVQAAGDAGNRLATLIIYLNTLPASAGGATCFQHLNLQVRPEAGKALLFFPCFAKDGSSDDRTLHCGQVSFETKWIAQIWVRQGKYQPVLPPGNNHAEARVAVEQLSPNLGEKKN